MWPTKKSILKNKVSILNDTINSIIDYFLQAGVVQHKIYFQECPRGKNIKIATTNTLISYKDNAI